jgi:hypothetical protein
MRGMLMRAMPVVRPVTAFQMPNEGYDPQFGARPLKRVIQQRIENAIATRLLAGDFQPGDTIDVDYDAEQFTLTRGTSRPRKIDDYAIETELIEE